MYKPLAQTIIAFHTLLDKTLAVSIMNMGQFTCLDPLLAEGFPYLTMGRILFCMLAVTPHPPPHFMSPSTGEWVLCI